jgi:hypothetical protein
VKLTLQLPANDVASIDAEAEKPSRDEPYGRTVTRTAEILVDSLARHFAEPSILKILASEAPS